MVRYGQPAPVLNGTLRIEGVDVELLAARVIARTLRKRNIEIFDAKGAKTFSPSSSMKSGSPAGNSTPAATQTFGDGRDASFVGDELGSSGRDGELVCWKDRCKTWFVAFVATPLLATTGAAVGVPTGFIVGLVAALLLLMIVYTAKDGVTSAVLLKVAPQLAAVPVLVFGGKWAAGNVVADVDWGSARPSYLAALAATIGVFVVPVMFALAYRIARRLVQA